MMNPDIQSATEAHATAVALLAEHTAAANGAADHLRTAQALRQQLLDKASAGEPVSTSDLRGAADALHEAENRHAIQDAIRAGTAQNADRAEITLLAARAAAHEAAFEAAIDRRISAAAKADAAMSTLAAAMADLESAGRDITAARQTANLHNEQLNGLAKRNSVLLRLGRPEWPKTRVREDGRVFRYRIALPADANEFDSIPIPKNATLVVAERGMWGRPAIAA